MLADVLKYQGTWRFLSAALLKYPLKPNELSDDIESFYHLLLLYSLRFHRHGLNPGAVRAILDGEYDEATYDHGYWQGGDLKWDRLEQGTLPCKPRDAPVFSRLLKNLARIFQRHYTGLDRKLAQYTVAGKTSSSQDAAASGPSMDYDDDDDDNEFLGCFEDEDDSEDDSDNWSLSETTTTAASGQDRTLDSHAKFGKIMKKALEHKGWAADDKLDHDFFDLIDWTPAANGRGSKSARESRHASKRQSLAGSKRSAPQDDRKDAAGPERPAKRSRTEPTQAKKESPRRIYGTRSRSKSQTKYKSSATRKGSTEASGSKPRLTRASSKASGSKPRS